jgi:hypothetical protein
MAKDWVFVSKSDRSRFARLLKPLAQRFASCHRDYMRFSENGAVPEVGWWYNERTNIGFLAAAAWRHKGSVALEEYSKIKSKKNGRADLFIGMRANGRLIKLAFEAKQVWAGGLKWMKNQLNPKNPKSALSRAIADVKRAIKKGQADYRCAVVFICPTIAAGENAEKKFDNMSDAFFEAVHSLKSHDWVAFSVHIPVNSHLKWPDNKMYPALGVLVVDV